MKKTAVVILNWNGHKLLEQFLPSVVQYTTLDKVEIVVADNCSTDDSVEFVKNAYPQITCICLPKNYGYAEGYNKALRQIDAEYFILLNSDVEVSSNWLSPMIEHFDTNEDVVAIQPKILAQRNKTHYEYAGASGGFIDKYGYPFCRGRIFNDVEQDKGQYNTPMDIFWVSGACFMVRAKEFFEVGGLDASFFAHMEEIDLCWRFNSRGWRLVCLPSCVVYHVGGATLSEDNPHKTYLNFRNNLLMLYKNLPQKNLKKIMYVRIMLDIVAALKFAVTGNFSSAVAVYKAHKRLLKIRFSYRDVRKENLQKTTQSDIKTMYHRSILAAYYLKGHKKFSQLEDFVKEVSRL